jgi:hypothetical protein
MFEPFVVCGDREGARTEDRGIDEVILTMRRFVDGSCLFREPMVGLGEGQVFGMYVMLAWRSRGRE